jgi:hypothetical protein
MPQDVSFIVEPATASNRLNTQHTVTATYALDSVPQEGVSVEFKVMSSPNTGDKDSDVTDASGQATFTYTGDGGIGQDLIRAVVVDQAGVPVVWGEVTKDWTSSHKIILSPATARNPVNTRHTVIATYLYEDVPQQGVKVLFRVYSGPNIGKTGSGTTDINGQATFTYTGDGGIGKDTIEADIFDEVSSLLASAQATKDWTASGPVKCVGGNVQNVNKYGVPKSAIYLDEA